MKLIQFKPKSIASKALQPLPFNRVVKDTSNLELNMSQGWEGAINIIETDLISGVKEQFIADGHHRVEVAKRLNITFYGMVSPRKFKSITEIVDYVASLNNTQKAWSTLDYVKAYCYLRNSEYLRLAQLTNSSLYSVDTIAKISYGATPSTTVREQIITGKYICNYPSHTEYIINLSQELTKTRKPNSREILAISYLSLQDSWKERKFLRLWKLRAKDLPTMEANDTLQNLKSWL